MKKSIIVLVAIVCAIAPVLSNKPPKKQKGATPAPSASESAAANTEKPKDKMATIESKTKNCVKIDGLCPLYQDSTDGKLYLLVNAKQLNTEFIHFAYTENGVIAAGLHRGQYRDSRIFTITKFYGNLEFSQINTNFYFNPNSPLAKAKKPTSPMRPLPLKNPSRK